MPVYQRLGNTNLTANTLSINYSIGGLPYPDGATAGVNLASFGLTAASISSITLTSNTISANLLLAGNFQSSTVSASNITGTAINYDSADWTGGNMIWVPLNIAGKTQTEVLNEAIANATAGDTLRLASGTYTITDNILINKAINIRGEGVATTITCNTSGKTILNITASNVRIIDLNLTTTDGSMYGIACNSNLLNIVIKGVTVVLTGTGTKRGMYLGASNVNILNCLIVLTSSDGTTYGIYGYNNSSTTLNNTINILDTVITVSGATEGEAFFFYNNNDANTITVNLYNCDGHAFPTSGTSDCGMELYSNTTNTITVNAHNSAFSGADSDIKVENPNILNLLGCILENDTVSKINGGIINYLGTQVSNSISSNSISTTTLAFIDGTKMTTGPGSWSSTSVFSGNYSVGTNAIMNFLSGSVTANLPTPIGSLGKFFTFKTTGTCSATLSATVGLIDNAITQVITDRFVSLTLISDNTNWYIV